MADSRFFTNHGPFLVSALTEISGAHLADGGNANLTVTDVCPLDRANATEISFFDNSKYLEQYTHSNAGVCFVREKYAKDAPTSMTLLICDDPYRSYALVAQKFYPRTFVTTGISPLAVIDSTANIGKNVSIAAGAVIEANVVIADNVSIGANTVISYGVTISKNTVIGPLSSLSHCVIGENIIIHRGVHIGQDGFGFAMGRGGHVKVPQLGRVVIEDNVEIGSGTTIDRGTGPDTVIGLGTKIDNLVQIGHNVHIGKHVIIVAQVGISGSTRIGDGAVIGGQSGIAGHLKIGSGVKIAAQSGVMNDLIAGNSYGGYPAIAIRDWHRQTIALAKVIKTKRGGNDD